MRRNQILPFLLIVVLHHKMQAQTPAPKPNPEVKKLHVLVGHWTGEGEYKPGPLGPGGKITGEYTYRMILGGFFLQGWSTERGPMGETQGLEIDGYDPVNKNLTGNLFSDDGSTFSGVWTVSGNKWIWAGNFVLAGKQYMGKNTVIFAKDWMSATSKVEISVDGKTWTPLLEDKWTKIKPTPRN
jgi:hypothetical protein